jgi:hypothetical protein
MGSDPAVKGFRQDETEKSAMQIDPTHQPADPKSLTVCERKSESTPD